jgi:hypothetical protein
MLLSSWPFVCMRTNLRHVTSPCLQSFKGPGCTGDLSSIDSRMESNVDGTNRTDYTHPVDTCHGIRTKQHPSDARCEVVRGGNHQISTVSIMCIMWYDRNEMENVFYDREGVCPMEAIQK